MHLDAKTIPVGFNVQGFPIDFKAQPHYMKVLSTAVHVRFDTPCPTDEELLGVVQGLAHSKTFTGSEAATAVNILDN